MILILSRGSSPAVLPLPLDQFYPRALEFFNHNLRRIDNVYAGGSVSFARGHGALYMFGIAKKVSAPAEDKNAIAFSRAASKAFVYSLRICVRPFSVFRPFQLNFESLTIRLEKPTWCRSPSLI